MRNSERNVLLVGALTLASVAIAQPVAGGWHPGEPVPAGAEETVHEDPLLMSVGGALFALPYLASSLDATLSYPSDAASTARLRMLWVPAVGPFIVAGRGGSAGAVTLRLLDGLSQVAGLTTLVYAVLHPRHVLVPAKEPAVGVLPWVAPGGGGAALCARF